MIDFKFEAKQFLVKIFHKINEQKIDIRTHWSIDHLCYRVNTIANYHQIKNQLQMIGKMLIESEVNGRLIATFKLHDPIIFEGRAIDLIELPAPKRNKVTIEGFEHIEFVCDLPMSSLIEEFRNLNIDQSGLDKPINQELEIILDEFAIKFHHYSLESVINLEKNSRVHDAIMRSTVLSVLKKRDPLIVGTFPLRMEHSKSDVDVIVTTYSIDDLKNEFRTYLASFDDFSIHESLQNISCRFVIDEVPFEIYGESSATVSQNGFLHFQIEEKLLKLGGEEFRRKVMYWRDRGDKTEAAFLKALGLSGDPFQTLLDLQKRPEIDLMRLVNKI